MTVAMFCLRELPPRDEQPMMAARALATLRAHFVRPTRRLRRGRIPAIAAIATSMIALYTVRGVLIFPFIVDFSCCGWCAVPLHSPWEEREVLVARPVGLGLAMRTHPASACFAARPSASGDIPSCLAS